MAAWRYEFYLRVLKVSFILSALEDKIRIPARPCNILYLHGCVCECVLCGFRIPIPTIIVKSVGKAATSYLSFLPLLTLAQCD